MTAGGCDQGSRQEQGIGTTEHSPAAPHRQVQQEENTSEEETAHREAPFTATLKMKGGGLEGVADSMHEVRLGKHEGYERAVIDFGSEGAPASRAPVWSLSSPASCCREVCADHVSGH